MACLLIGSKIEEELRPVSRIVKTFYAIYQKRVGLPITELPETDPVIFSPYIFVICRFSFDGEQFYFKQKCLFFLLLAITYTELLTIRIVIFSFSSKYISHPIKLKNYITLLKYLISRNSIAIKS